MKIEKVAGRGEEAGVGSKDGDGGRAGSESSAQEKRGAVCAER